MLRSCIITGEKKMSLYNFQLRNVKYFCQVYDGSGAGTGKTQDVTATTVMYSFVPKSSLLTTTQKRLYKKDTTQSTIRPFVQQNTSHSFGIETF